jgi:phage baseplate assembly protein W
MSVADNAETTKIKESIYLVLNTYFSDRVMETTFGSKLLDLIFENMDVTLVAILTYQIEQALGLWEKRIKVENVFVDADTVSGIANVRVEYTVLNLQIQDSAVVALRGGR